MDAVNTIMPLMGLAARSASRAVDPGQGDDLRGLDNTQYHHARLVQRWLPQPGRRTTLHVISVCCPYLDPIEQLWALRHRHIHDQCYARAKERKAAILDFLRDTVPRTSHALCDEVTNNLRAITPAKPGFSAERGMTFSASQRTEMAIPRLAVRYSGHVRRE